MSATLRRARPRSASKTTPSWAVWETRWLAGASPWWPRPVIRTRHRRLQVNSGVLDAVWHRG